MSEFAPIPENLRIVMNDIAGKINFAIKQATETTGNKYGFIFFCFDYGPGGTMSWISSAERETALDALEEFLRHSGR